MNDSGLNSMNGRRRRQNKRRWNNHNEAMTRVAKKAARDRASEHEVNPADGQRETPQKENSNDQLDSD